MNIIYNENLDVRATQFKESGTYSLEDLKFYVPIAFNSYGVFVVLSNGQLFDVCKLQYIETSNNYKIFGMSYDQKLRTPSGKCKIGVILLSADLTDVRVSKSLHTDIDIKNYNLTHQLYVTQEVNSSVRKMYDDMLNMSNMVIEIYEKLQGGQIL